MCRWQKGFLKASNIKLLNKWLLRRPRTSCRDCDQM